MFEIVVVGWIVFDFLEGKFNVVFLFFEILCWMGGGFCVFFNVFRFRGY